MILHGLIVLGFLLMVIVILWVLNMLFMPVTVPFLSNCVSHDTSGKELKVAILLTMYTGNDDYRKNLYKSNIKKWLKDFDVFTVDSSNKIYKIPCSDHKLHTYSFDQGTGLSSNPSAAEKRSLLKACRHFKDKFKDYDIIFKITGKYYTPDLKKYISGKYTTIPDVIVQNNVNTYGQNTEVIGFKARKMEKIIYTMCKSYLELSLKNNIMKSGEYTVYRLPAMSIPNKVKRGDGCILKYL